MPSDVLYYTATPVQAMVVDETIGAKIDRYALEYKVSSEVMQKVIKCESGFNPKAIGDGGKSRGLVQIYAPAHPTITAEQAFDPDFAISFLAKNLAEGKGNLWTCFKLMK